MKTRWWAALCVSAALALGGSAVRAQDHGDDHDHGHGHAYGKERHEDRDHHDDRDWRDRDHRYYGDWYSTRYREDMRRWYFERERRHDLPPGLARRDDLPPGLERQLVIRGELPPGLRRRMHPCPPELVRELPPPPPDCENVIIGGHIVLWNRRTNIVVDIVHFERW